MDNLFEGLEGFGFSAKEEVDLFKKKPVKVKEDKKKIEMSAIDYIFDKKYTCPCCNAQFQEKAVKQMRLRFVKSDIDMMPFYEPVNPLFYGIVLCPSCGYASLTQTFKTLTEKQSEIILSKITPSYRPKEYPENFDASIAVERYKLALYVAALIHAKDGEKAFLCLKIAWLYKLNNDKKRELLFVKNALTGFQKAFENEHFPIMGMDEYMLQYIIANCFRKSKAYDEALRWIGGIIVSREVNARLKEKSLDLKTLITEEKKKAATKKTASAI